MSQANNSQKIAIVTGGSRGIGRATVLALAGRNVATIFTYNSNKEEALTTAAEAKILDTPSVPLQLDLSQPSTFATFVQNVKQALTQLNATHFDYLVNNAANNHKNMPFEQVTEEELDSIYQVHFKAPLLLTQALLPLINDWGRILNISTARARIAMPGGAAYASMKGALEVLTRHMAKELAPRRITANILAPGAVETDFSGGIVRDNPTVNKMVADNTALGRAGLPSDIGPAIAALLSDDCGWLNGQRIEAAGGVML